MVDSALALADWTSMWTGDRQTVNSTLQQIGEVVIESVLMTCVCQVITTGTVSQRCACSQRRQWQVPSDDDHLFFPILSIDWHFIDDFASLSFPFLLFSHSTSHFFLTLLCCHSVFQLCPPLFNLIVQQWKWENEQMEHVAPCSTLRNGNWRTVFGVLKKRKQKTNRDRQQWWWWWPSVKSGHQFFGVLSVVQRKSKQPLSPPLISTDLWKQEKTGMSPPPPEHFPPPPQQQDHLADITNLNYHHHQKQMSICVWTVWEQCVCVCARLEHWLTSRQTHMLSKLWSQSKSGR